MPAGTACKCTPYVDLVGEQLARQGSRPAAVTNLSVPGLTSGALLDQLQDSPVPGVLAHADLVTVTIGANDFDQSKITAAGCSPAAGLPCYTKALNGLRQRLTTILSQVRSLQPTDGRLVVTGYWNVFVDGAVARERGMPTSPPATRWPRP